MNTANYQPITDTQLAVIKNRLIYLAQGDRPAKFMAWWNLQNTQVMPVKASRLSKYQASEIICELMQRNWGRAIELWEQHTNKLSV